MRHGTQRAKAQGNRKADGFRRARLGQVRCVLRRRYGDTLPDDDAGRDDLHELLLLNSLHPTHPVEQMWCEIEVWAPWMSEEEGSEMIDNVLKLPVQRRWRNKKALGERLRLTLVERQRAKAHSIHPVGLTEEEMKERAKQHAKWIRMAKRRVKGATPRQEWLERNPTARKAPWKALGISKATYYRRVAAGTLDRETGSVAEIINITCNDTTCLNSRLTPEQAERPTATMIAFPVRR
jgi:hypothetical protein